MGSEVNLAFLTDRKTDLLNRIAVEKSRDARQTVATLEIELEITNLAIKGLLSSRS